MSETITLGKFMDGLVRLGRPVPDEPHPQPDLPIKRSSSFVANATEAHGLTLAELNYIFKGA